MILGFKTQFNDKIISREKIHTIRKGKRWRPGMKIQFYNHVRTKKMVKFKHDQVCIGVQNIKIEGYSFIIFIDGKFFSPTKYLSLAINDGFDNIAGFLNWFDKPFEGQIIHWTDFKY